MNQTELIEALRQFSTTELCDGMTTFRVLDSAIHRMVTTKKIVGPAFPVEVPAGRRIDPQIKRIHRGVK
ncbi:MAG: hypothetical protein ACI4OO_03420 [Otoolea sp.]|nr:hypothetical protein [Clostridium sp.]MDY5484921.1 hypothetical protein [Clostridium sp.]